MPLYFPLGGRFVSKIKRPNSFFFFCGESHLVQFSPIKYNDFEENILGKMWNCNEMYFHKIREKLPSTKRE